MTIEHLPLLHRLDSDRKVMRYLLGRAPVRCHSAEIGWRVERRYWRRGFATEGARSLLEHGFGTVGLELVRAETMAVNIASRRVLRKLGMHYVRTEVRKRFLVRGGRRHLRDEAPGLARSVDGRRSTVAALGTRLVRWTIVRPPRSSRWCCARCRSHRVDA